MNVHEKKVIFFKKVVILFYLFNNKSDGGKVKTISIKKYININLAE